MNMGINMEDTKGSRLIRQYSQGGVMELDKATLHPDRVSYNRVGFNVDLVDVISEATLAIAEIVAKHEGILDNRDTAHNVVYCSIMETIATMAMAEQVRQIENAPMKGEPTGDDPQMQLAIRTVKLASCTDTLANKTTAFSELLKKSMGQYMSVYVRALQEYSNKLKMDD